MNLKRALALIFAMCMYNLQSYADDHAFCFNSIHETAKYIVFTETAVECMNQDHSYSELMSYLCAENEPHSSLGPSVALSKYLDFEKQYLLAQQALMIAANPADRAIANMEVTKINRNWSLRGYKNEVAQALSKLSRINYRCTHWPQ